MDIKKLIKLKMAEKGVYSDTDLVRRIGWSQSRLANKYYRDSWKVADLEKIAEALDCTLVIKFKEKDQ